MHPRHQPNQSLRSHQIPRPQQLRQINIQRTIRLPSRPHQLLHRLQRTHDPIRRRPRSLQQIETDLSSLEVDVGVAAGGEEMDGGWGGRIVGGNGDGEVEETAWRVVNG